MDILSDVANRDARTVTVELDDIVNFCRDTELAEKIQTNTKRYEDLVKKAIDEALPMRTTLHQSEDVIDVLYVQRVTQLEDEREEGEGADQPVDRYLPDDLRRRYEVRFSPRSDAKPLPIRKVLANCIGGLVTVRGIVTRVTDVKPQATTITYTCDQCGCEAYQEVKSRNFMPQTECSSRECQIATTKGRLLMQTRGSKFEKFQELRLQEVPEEVPVGHTPRQVPVIVRGETTRKCGPGDVITLSGIFLPVPVSGYRGMKMGLTAETYLDAQIITKDKLRSDEDGASTAIRDQVLATDKTDMYEKLAKSIAPEIFGHEDVKKALMLLLVGGVTKKMKDGMKIRGDLNVCLMGDPGVAKSQLLKHISSIAPRGVYTTGKGSSGVGLTAAVLRDPHTQELVLEGGALVLADTGICCIDEFDKMDESDRTAIHEVMEQQTISIAKAGITTTLNARTSILAAANPLHGRYNIKRSPEENIDLPTALLSRFDLLFLLLDIPNKDNDANLARHILHVHQHNTHPALTFEPFAADFMRAYVEECQRIEPYVTDELADFIVEQYVTVRNSEDDSTKKYTHPSARTLLSILRQSQALARVRFSEVVERADVDEAIRLMESSHASVENMTASQAGARGAARKNPITEIYNIINTMARLSSDHSCKRADVVRRAVGRSFPESQVDECIEEYETLGVWQYDATEGSIRLILVEE